MLYKNTIGAGDEVVLLHGWGFSGAIFNDLMEKYQDKYCLSSIDLPGHGKSADVDGGLCEWAAEIIKILPPKPILVGWSLGGLLALEIARKVPLKSLILLASSPKFVNTKNWNYGIDADNFQNFSDTLYKNHNSAIKRFVSLQTKNKAQIKKLNHTIDANPASKKALKQGLDMLLKTDMSKVIPSLKTPISAILGNKDNLVPAKISQWYQSNGVKTEILKCGHLPFVEDEFKFEV